MHARMTTHTLLLDTHISCQPPAPPGPPVPRSVMMPVTRAVSGGMLSRAWCQSGGRRTNSKQQVMGLLRQTRQW